MTNQFPPINVIGMISLAGLYFIGAASAAMARADAHEPPAKPAFYATSAACAAGGLFRKPECENAFTNAASEVREDQIASASRLDCVARFRLCERAGADGAYAPVALGVEMVRNAGVAYSTPVLAVATPRGLLPPRPAMPQAPEQLAPPRPLLGLPTDHFERIDPRSVREAWRHFAPLQGQEQTRLVPSAFLTEADPEPMQARRARLQAAPYVE